VPKKHRLPAEDSEQVRDLLRRYACPVPYHEVRTRFLGNIATPKLSASPLNVAKGLWGGAFPEVESIEDLNCLIDTLIKGLWNALTIHQKRSEPFRLVKVPVEPSVANWRGWPSSGGRNSTALSRGCSTARMRSTCQRRRMPRSAFWPR
jgi:hypothetical protein